MKIIDYYWKLNLFLIFDDFIYDFNLFFLLSNIKHIKLNHRILNTQNNPY